MVPDPPASTASAQREPASLGGLLPVVTPATAVPVYDCHIILEGPDCNGVWSGWVTNIPGVSATAAGERELLRRLVELFKQELQRLRTAGAEVPWNREPVRPGPGQQQRWVPVHL